jgi:glycosyltransferase involved in cell wall biosynthesis
MRIVIVADNASSRFGGEAFIPLNYFRLLRARNADVRLLVHERNKSELLELFRHEQDRLYFVQDTSLHKALFRYGQLLPRRLEDATTSLLIHLTTQSSQRRILRDLVKQYCIDVVHQPIPVSPKTPSQIWGVGASAIIGPLNGGMEYPPAFNEHGTLARLALLLGRARELCQHAHPRQRLARFILVANHRTQQALPIGIKGQVVEMVENGVDFNIWRTKTYTNLPGPTVRFIFIGRLIDWKALEIVIEAMARLQGQISASFEVIGDGPMRKDWEHAAHQMGLAQTVKFSGFMSQQDCADRLKKGRRAGPPKFIRSGGAVVLKALELV